MRSLFNPKISQERRKIFLREEIFFQISEWLIVGFGLLLDMLMIERRRKVVP